MAFYDNYDLEEDLDEELIHDQFILNAGPTVALYDDYFAPDDEYDEEFLLDSFILQPAPKFLFFDDYWLVEDDVEEELLIDSSYVQIPALVVIGSDDAWPYVEDVDEELPLKDDFFLPAVVVPVVPAIIGGSGGRGKVYAKADVIMAHWDKKPIVDEQKQLEYEVKQQQAETKLDALEQQLAKLTNTHNQSILNEIEHTQHLLEQLYRDAEIRQLLLIQQDAIEQFNRMYLLLF